MTILRRYMIKTMLQANLFVMFASAGLLFFLTLLVELRDVGHGDYGLVQAIAVVTMQLPNLLYQFLPILVLLGSLMGIGVLHVYRELLTMRIMGISLVSLNIIILSAAVFFIVLMTLISECIAPNLSHLADIYKENSMHKGQVMVMAEGIWFHEGNNFIHINRVLGHDVLEKVTRYQFDCHQRLKTIYFAQQVFYEKHHWIMHDVFKTDFTDQKIQHLFFPKLTWNLQFNSSILHAALAEPTEMTLKKLMYFSYYLKENGLQANLYQYEFWKRVFQPFASFFMICLTIPFALNSLYLKTFNWRFLVSVLLGCLLYLSNALLNEFCLVYQISSLFAAAVPLLLLALIAFILFAK